MFHGESKVFGGIDLFGASLQETADKSCKYAAEQGDQPE